MSLGKKEMKTMELLGTKVALEATVEPRFVRSRFTLSGGERLISDRREQ